MQLFFFNATRTVYFKRQPDETGESPTRFPQAGKGFEGVEKGSFRAKGEEPNKSRIR